MANTDGQKGYVSYRLSHSETTTSSSLCMTADDRVNCGGNLKKVNLCSSGTVYCRKNQINAKLDKYYGDFNNKLLAY